MKIGDIFLCLDLRKRNTYKSGSNHFMILSLPSGLLIIIKPFLAEMKTKLSFSRT